MYVWFLEKDTVRFYNVKVMKLQGPECELVTVHAQIFLYHWAKCSIFWTTCNKNFKLVYQFLQCKIIYQLWSHNRDHIMNEQTIALQNFQTNLQTDYMFISFGYTRLEWQSSAIWKTRTYLGNWVQNGKRRKKQFSVSKTKKYSRNHCF